MKKPVRFAIDNGYYDHKVAYWEGDQIRTFKYPVVIGTEQEALNSMDGKLVGMYESEGNRYVVDPSVSNKISLRIGEYGSSAENRVLVNHGLHKAGVRPDQEVHLTTALPVRDYYKSNGTKNHALINPQKENMLKPVYVVKSLDGDIQPEQVARITDSRVMSEGVAAVVDFLVQDTSGNARQMRAPIAVFDFGGRTFDIVTVMPGMVIRQSSSGTLTRGTYDIRETFKPMLADYLSEQGVKMKIAPDWMVSEAFETGAVEVADNEAPDGMRSIPVRDLINEAAGPIVNECKRFAQQTLPNMAEYEAILLAGGGGLLCEPLFEDWKQDYNLIVRDEFANARGMLKIDLVL